MLNATVTNRIDVTSELVIFSISPDEPHKEFLAGQYVAIGLPGSAPRPEHFPAEATPPDPEKVIKRAYSIGSAPTSAELEFYIAIVPHGVLTSRLALTKKGDRIFVAPKITGTFTLEAVPDNKDLVFVATGTGLAPYMAMLRTEGVLQRAHSITIIHGVRYPSDLGYRDELLAYAEAHPIKFHYHPIVSRPAGTTWQGHTGHAQSLFTSGQIKLNAEKQNVFMCGNPAMVEELQKILEAHQFTEHSRKNPAGNMHLEKYW